MNEGLRRELALLCTVGSSVAFATKRRNFGVIFGLAAGALTLLKSPAESFAGKTAIITGGSRGLGLALARRLVSEEAKVIIIARDQEELMRARDLILKESPNAKVHPVVCDVTDELALVDALNEADREHGPVDLLINNAGAIVVGPFESMTRQDFEAQLNLHLHAVSSTVRWVLPQFRRRGGGRIINICSMGGKVAVPHMLPYDVSKFALAGFSQGLSAELSKDGICVTTVYPALLRTGSPIQAVFKGDHEKEYAWFAMSDSLPGISMCAHSAAHEIIEASREHRTELILSLPAKARMAMGAFFPETMNWVMSMLNRAMPNGTQSTGHTGADSNRLLKEKSWAQPFQAMATRWEKEHNQQPKHDAEYAMGLSSTQKIIQ